MKRHVMLAIFSFALTSQNAAAQELVTVTAKEPKSAAGKHIKYSGVCENTSYILEVSHEMKKMHLQINGTTSVSLTDSQIGKAVLQRPLAGDFAFRCIDDLLEIVYLGFLLDIKAPPRPVEYFMSISFSGKIKHDDGLADADITTITKYFTRRNTRPSRQP